MATNKNSRLDNALANAAKSGRASLQTRMLEASARGQAKADQQAIDEAMDRSNPGVVPAPARNPADTTNGGTPAQPWNIPASDHLPSGLRRYVPQFQQMDRPGQGLDMSSRAQTVDPYIERTPDNIGPDGNVQNFDSHGQNANAINMQRDQGWVDDPDSAGGFFSTPEQRAQLVAEAQRRLDSRPGQNGRPALEQRFQADPVRQDLMSPGNPNGSPPPGAAPASNAQNGLTGGAPAQGSAFGGGGQQPSWMERARSSMGRGGGGSRPQQGGGRPLLGGNPMFGGGQPAPPQGQAPDMFAGGSRDFDESAGGAAILDRAVMPGGNKQTPRRPAPGMSASAGAAPSMGVAPPPQQAAQANALRGPPPRPGLQQNNGLGFRGR